MLPSDGGLDQLDAPLLAHTNEDGMLISEFDGLCAGLILCPELSIPGEWLPCFWGSSTENLETLEDIQRVTDLLMRHYNDIAQSWMPQVSEYGALYEEGQMDRVDSLL